MPTATDSPAAPAATPPVTAPAPAQTGATRQPAPAFSPSMDSAVQAALRTGKGVQNDGGNGSSQTATPSPAPSPSSEPTITRDSTQNTTTVRISTESDSSRPNGIPPFIQFKNAPEAKPEAKESKPEATPEPKSEPVKESPPKPSDDSAPSQSVGLAGLFNKSKTQSEVPSEQADDDLSRHAKSIQSDPHGSKRNRDLAEKYLQTRRENLELQAERERNLKELEALRAAPKPAIDEEAERELTAFRYVNHPETVKEVREKFDEPILNRTNAVLAFIQKQGVTIPENAIQQIRQAGWHQVEQGAPEFYQNIIEQLPKEWQRTHVKALEAQLHGLAIDRDAFIEKGKGQAREFLQQREAQTAQQRLQQETQNQQIRQQVMEYVDKDIPQHPALQAAFKPLPANATQSQRDSYEQDRQVAQSLQVAAREALLNPTPAAVSQWVKIGLDGLFHALELSKAQAQVDFWKKQAESLKAAQPGAPTKIADRQNGSEPKKLDLVMPNRFGADTGAAINRLDNAAENFIRTQH